MVVLVGLGLVGCRSGRPPSNAAPEASADAVVVVPDHEAAEPDTDEEAEDTVPDRAQGAQTSEWSVAIRDPRTAMAPRALAVVTAETQGLEHLLAATPDNSPDRPQLLRRLAENYAELRRAQAWDARGQERAGDPAEAARLKQLAQTASQKAIQTYALLAQTYPTYAKLDEVLYFLAYEHELAGELLDARKRYFELIQKAPQSRWVPAAYLAFGELFAAEAAGDASRWPLAEAAYREVTRHPPPTNATACYAHLRLASALEHQGRLPESQGARAEAARCARAYPNLPGSRELSSALR